MQGRTAIGIVGPYTHGVAQVCEELRKHTDAHIITDITRFEDLIDLKDICCTFISVLQHTKPIFAERVTEKIIAETDYIVQMTNDWQKHVREIVEYEAIEKGS